MENGSGEWPCRMPEKHNDNGERPEAICAKGRWSVGLLPLCRPSYSVDSDSMKCGLSRCADNNPDTGGQY